MRSRTVVYLIIQIALKATEWPPPILSRTFEAEGSGSYLRFGSIQGPALTVVELKYPDDTGPHRR